MVLLFCLLAKSSLYAQSNYYKKGQSSIDVYYGLPNFYPTIIKKGYNNNFDLTRGMRPDYQTTNFNPVGIKFERLITDDIGVGMNVFYAKSVIEWQDALYIYKSSIARLRIGLTYNYHFSNSKKWDPYFTAQLGYSNINYTFDQKSIIDSIPVIHPVPDIKFDYPITLRAGIGVRYHFSEKMGMFAETGLGGVMFLVGFSFKF